MAHKTLIMRAKYLWICMQSRSGYRRADYLKKHNVFAGIGEKCYFQPYVIPSDAKHIRLHNNVVVASGVQFIAHDVIHYVLNAMEENADQAPLKAYYADIEVFDNVFIGANAMILPGVKIGPNAICAGGCVVSKDVPAGVIVGGNPMRVIGDFGKLAQKRRKLENAEMEQKAI